MKAYLPVVAQVRRIWETEKPSREQITITTRLARFVRMTVSFSKSEVMHKVCLLLFLSRYNLEQAIILK